jgi:class 3 adenylate cyclase
MYFVVFGGYLTYNNYYYIQTEIRWYNTEGQTSKKKEMIQDFILRLIPKHLSSQIGSAELSLGSTYNNVTMLFADIVGFTAYSADKTPKEVVRMLSKLFTSFDKECNKLQLYKVYTIGDCYVVMSFLDGNERIEPEQECADVVELGFSMIEIIAKVRKEVNFDGLHMRIGIHTGAIIGGIVGTDIIRFDLYGSDVLIANKMESNGQQDRIHISQSSKDLLDKVNKSKRYLFTPNGETEIKALNRKVVGYFIDKNVQHDMESSDS